MSQLPRPDEVAIHVHTSAGASVGPLSRRQLAAKVGTELAATDHVWWEGLSGWTPISQVGGLLDDIGEKKSPGGARKAGESEADYYERVFGDLIKGSWDYLTEHSFSAHIDEVFLGAVITAVLDTGYSLIDISSDGTHHYLRFQKMDDQSRLIFRLTHLTSSLALSKVLGQRASVIVGYGERIGNAGSIMSAIRAEYQSGYINNPEPGTITVDGDLNTGYVYCQVDMYWTIDDYVNASYEIQYTKLAEHIRASTHALRKYLRGRFA